MSDSLPIISHVHAPLTFAEKHQAVAIARSLRDEYSELTPDSLFRDLRVVNPIEGRAFHCDDLSVIQQPVGFPDFHVLQERSRLRAVDGDYMATSFVADTEYAAYCRDQLGLGDVQWLTPAPLDNSLRLAEACWEDREVRRRLVHAIRQEDLAYIHPHQGTNAVWQLALLLSQTAHRPVRVIGAPPGLDRFVNDKGKFTQLVQRVFGEKSTPPTNVVWNRATAANCVLRLAESGSSVALKLPSSAGGRGNLNLPMDEVRGKSVVELDLLLREILDQFGYESGDELLATVWESPVIGNPSAQMWIPAAGHGEPVLEGLFQQFISERHGKFVGAMPVEVPANVSHLMASRCMLLATVFQELGYVGRCSFDLVLVGDSIETANLKFIECNGRWGGSSIPMTLMNRLFGDWKIRPFASYVLKLHGAGCVPWAKWLDRLGTLGFDRRTGQGKFILLNPQTLTDGDQLSVIALAENYSEAKAAVQEEFPHWARRVLEEEKFVQVAVCCKGLKADSEPVAGI